MVNDRYIELIPAKAKESYLRYIAGEELAVFSSHQPVIIHTLNTITEGDVLEFGMGFHSTPLMHIICGMQARQLHSIDTDDQWYAKFTKYQYSLHTMQLVYKTKVLKETQPYLNKHYSIIFVDGAPAQIRQPFIEKMIDKCDYMIVHDTECIVQGVKNVYAFDFTGIRHVHHLTSGDAPATSLLSNLEVINEDLLKVFNHDTK